MQKTRAVLSALLLLSVLIAATEVAAKDAKGTAKSTVNNALQTELDKIFNDIFAADAPGGAVIVTRGGETLLRAGYGMADLEHGIPIEPDMVFRLGSITKQFTAVGIMMLAEEGKLSVDDDITQHLPGYPAPKTRVTIEHLLTHTSGIPSYTDNAELMAKVHAPYTVDEMLAVFKDQELEFEPGSQWDYNNSGYFLLGAIIEQVAGQSYADFVQQRIFAPLGMKKSYYGDHEQIIPKRARGYHRDEDGYINAPYLSMSIPYAAGSLLSTVDDLVLWNAALNSDRLLPQKVLQRMWSEYKLTNGDGTGYGYGWAVGENNGSPVIHHAGGIHGFSTMGIRLPEQDVYVAVLSNNPQSERGAGYLAQRAAALLSGENLNPAQAKVATETLESYVGVYQINEHDQRVITLENGQLFSQRTGGGKTQIYFSSKTEFFYQASLAWGRFDLDENGQVKGMTMRGWSLPEEFAGRTDQPIPQGPKIVEVDPAIYHHYEGKYELMQSFVLTVRRDGNRLLTQATGQAEIEIFPSGEAEFFNEDIGGQITFHRGEDDGQAHSLTLRQGGQEMTAQRIE